MRKWMFREMKKGMFREMQTNKLKINEKLGEKIIFQFWATNISYPLLGQGLLEATPRRFETHSWRVCFHVRIGVLRD